MTAPFDPALFLDAQNQVYPEALGELRAGRKQGHWMWFIFPQVAGLGRSPTAQRFALADLRAAQAYLGHPVLRARLVECVEAMLLHAPGSAAPRPLAESLGYPDDLKFHSCLTLFARAAPDEPVFRQALDAYFAGAEDEATLACL